MTTKQPDPGQLLRSARMLGIKGLKEDSPVDEMIAAINEKLGNADSDFDDQESQDQRTASVADALATHGPEIIATESGATPAPPGSIPNLFPTGQWQGRKARIRRLKTGNNDIGGAIFRWNGWPTIIPIDTDVDVAWPIFEIIKNCRGMKMTIRQEEDSRDRGRVKNIQEPSYYDKYPFTFIGVTPGTEHLPESAWEFTLDQYVEDFPNFSVRMWRQLCVLWEIDDAQAGIKPGLAPEKESELRRNAVHYHLNLPTDANREIRLRIRNEKRSEIGMPAKAA